MTNYFHHTRLIRVIVFSLALAYFPDRGQADSSYQDSSSGLLGAIARLHHQPNVVPGDAWARDLSRYPNVVGVYQVAGKVIIIAARDENHIIIFDMSNGNSAYINAQQGDNLLHNFKQYQIPFTAYHSTNSFGTAYTELRSNGSLCRGNFAEYYEVTSSKYRATHEFYIVETFSKPERLSYGVCMEGFVDHPSMKFYSSVDWSPAAIYLLPDGRVLVNAFNYHETHVVLLDKYLRQRSTLDGHIKIVEAAPINAWLAANDKGAIPVSGNPSELAKFVSGYVSHK